MIQPSVSLLACNRSVEEIEFAADQLGPLWPGYVPLLEVCREFRRTSQSLSTNRGFSQVTIAFVGPKNAGKSTLIGMLIGSDSKRARLSEGIGASHSTRQPTWFAAQPPHLFDEAHEQFIACHDSELVPLGFPYALLDTPGFNERDPSMRELATRALDSAAAIVLVVDRASIASGKVSRYLAGAAGAPIIPVVTLVRSGENGSDLLEWEEGLRARFQNVLPRIEIPDWHVGQGGSDCEQQKRQEARTALVQRLSEALAEAVPAVMMEPRLQRKLDLFRSQTAETARQNLRSTLEALNQLHQALSQLPAQALDVLLGQEHRIASGVRLRLRALLLERTPEFLFPWRLALSLANLVQGATDRIPAALVGSLPSLLTTAAAAAGNLRQSRALEDASSSGLRTRVEAAIKEQAGTRLQAVEHALHRDLGGSGLPPRTALDSAATLRGLETLQARSTALFLEGTEAFAPSKGAAIFWAVLGCLMFWAVFAWPVYGLYQDFATAAGNVVLTRNKTALEAFPSGALPMLLTSAFLGLFPMCVLLLLVRELLTPKSRSLECARALRAAHEAEIQRLKSTGLLRVEVSEPRLDACRCLLQVDW